MRKSPYTNADGFTLIELLVVISIIGILSSVVLASLNSAREKARNAQRLAQMGQYKTAFELAVSDNREYPDPNTTSWRCLGDFSDNSCWANGTSVAESGVLNNILDDYIPGPPATEGIVGSWEGAMYRCLQRPSGRCTHIDIRWFMEGTNQSCGGEIVLSNNYNGQNVTYCRLMRNL